MKQRRTALRWSVGVLTAGGLLLSGPAPAQAAALEGGSNRPVKAYKAPKTHEVATPASHLTPHSGGHTPTDTGWNGT